MGRLIDADKLLEETRRDRDYARKNGFLDMYYERQVLIDRIKAHPTAYDPEKVVEQLETMRMRYYLTYANTGNKTNDEVWEKVNRAVDNAIEIVKGRWKIMNTEVEKFADYLIEWIVSKCDLEFDRQTEFNIVRMIVDCVELYEKESKRE